MTASTTHIIRSSALDDVIAEETKVFVDRQPRSHEAAARALHVLPGGATSNWQIAEPQAVWMSHGQGPAHLRCGRLRVQRLPRRLRRQPGRSRSPAIVAAVSARVRLGTHFAQPTEDAVVVAENLAARFGLPQWRFANSGTEATMDAVHLMRAYTDRDLIIKVEGCYHGHHDSVQVSVLPEADEVGPVDAPLQRRRQQRHPPPDP